MCKTINLIIGIFLINLVSAGIIIVEPTSTTPQAPTNINISSDDIKTLDVYEVFDSRFEPVVWIDFDNLDGSGNPLDKNGDWILVNLSGTTQSSTNDLIGKVMNFDGVVSGIDITSFTFNTNKFYALSVWVKTSDSGHDQYIYDANERCLDAADYTRIFIDPNGILIVEKNGGTGNARSFSTSAVNDGEWHHIFVEQNERGIGHGVRIYIDGVLELEEFIASTGGVDLPIVNPYIGRRCWSPAGTYFNGSMDDFRIYNYANFNSVQWLWMPSDRLTGIAGSYFKNISHEESVTHNLIIKAWNSTGDSVNSTFNFTIQPILNTNITTERYFTDQTNATIILRYERIKDNIGDFISIIKRFFMGGI